MAGGITARGDYVVRMTLAGMPLAGEIGFRVTAAALNVQSSLAYGPGLHQSEAGAASHFSVEGRDAYLNTIPAEELACAVGTEAGAMVCRADGETLRAEYQLTLAGSYSLYVRLADKVGLIYIYIYIFFYSGG
jgi:hypothetical protein